MPNTDSNSTPTTEQAPHLPRSITLRRGDPSAYVNLPRAVVQDESLSYTALGLLAYLISFPEDTDFVLEDAAGSRGSLKALRVALRQLITAGYVYYLEDRS